MKKILSWLLVLAMLLTSLLTLVACDDDDEQPEEETLSKAEVTDLLSDAEEKMTDLDDYHVDIYAKIKMQAQGSSIEIPLALTVKLDDVQGENPGLAMTMSTQIMGEMTEMQVYCKDGWIYTVEDGVGIKEQMGDSLGGLGEDVALPEIDDETMQMLEQLYEEMLERADAVVSANGATEITFEFTVEELMELVNALMAQIPDAGLGEMGDMAGSFATVTEMLTGTVEFGMTVKDEYITMIEVNADLGMAMEGQSASFDVEFSAELVNPGESVTIVLPEGAEDFEDATDDGGWDDLLLPTTAEDAAAILEGLTYTVSVQNMDNGGIMVQAIGSDGGLALVYFDYVADAISFEADLEELLEGNSEVCYGRVGQVVWYGSEAVLNALVEEMTESLG